MGSEGGGGVRQRRDEINAQVVETPRGQWLLLSLVLVQKIQFKDIAEQIHLCRLRNLPIIIFPHQAGHFMVPLQDT